MPQQNGLIVGIDFGTTHSLVGVVESGFPIVLADDEGNRLLPSVVCFHPGGEVLVGNEAVRARAAFPERTISSIKRILGRRFTDLSPDDFSAFPCPITKAPGGEPFLHLDDDLKKTPQDIAAVIFERLLKITQTALEDESVSDAVVTVPAYFNQAQREATRDAAKQAGWTVHRILNEPTAAALAYGLDRADSSQRIAVYDLGGGTFDLSVLELRDGVFEVTATAGDTALGGDDIDIALRDWLAKEIGLDGRELSAAQEALLLEKARQAKEALSESKSHTVDLPFFDQSESFSAEIHRKSLDSLALPILQRTRAIGKTTLLEAQQKGADPLDHLILVGGSTRMPLVREKTGEWFGLQPNLSQHPDEAVALGAGIQAGILCGRVRQVVLVDVTPLSLGIETIGGLMNVIIPRNTAIPARAGELFTNAVSGQSSMSVRILQGERELAKDNWLLGEVAVPFVPGPKGSARVGVQFEIDENGILTVLTRDTQTGKDLVLVIENAAVDVANEAVEKMVSESIDHAFEDMNERILVETRMKSEELLPAVETALEAVGEQISPEERKAIEQSAAKLRALLEMNPPPLAELQAANTQLDECTQNLAAVLAGLAMERAFVAENPSKKA